jgi:excisionase family DNA binding protein
VQIHVDEPTVSSDGQATKSDADRSIANRRGTMRASTYAIVKAAVDADDTLSDAERQAILRFCREPVLPGATHVAALARWISPVQAAAALSVNLRTVQRWIAAGVLPSRRMAGSRRIPADALGALRVARRTNGADDDHWPAGTSRPGCEANGGMKAG